MSEVKQKPIVLVAEDEERIAGLLKTFLEVKGYDVVVVDSAKAAIDRINDTASPAPQLLFTDFGLADGNTGVDLIVAARNIHNCRSFYSQAVWLTAL